MVSDVPAAWPALAPCASFGAVPTDLSTDAAARGLARAYERGSLEGLLAMMDERVEVVPLPLVADRPYRGHEGVRRYVDDAATGWDLLRYSIHRIGVGGDRAVLLGRYRAGRDGSLQDGRVSWVLEVEAGRVRRAVAHPTWEAGLAEAGLALADTEPLAD
jgi:ketosteroid isomerase-like protein